MFFLHVISKPQGIVYSIGVWLDCLCPLVPIDSIIGIAGIFRLFFRIGSICHSHPEVKIEFIHLGVFFHLFHDVLIGEV
jgi:hypothetical protein